ncbi:MAG: hypothetical protein WCK67_05205 [bacterium]
MKKKIILSGVILMFAVVNSSVYANAALVNGVLDQLMQKAIYNIGSKVIDKFAPYPQQNGMYNYQQPVNATYTPPVVYTPPVNVNAPPSTTTTNVNTNSSINTTNGVTEQLIPITSH